MLKYLYIALALSLGGLWLTDRTHQYGKGKYDCAQEQAAKNAEDSKRQEQQYQKRIEQAVKEAVEASKHISSLQDTKVKAIEHTKTIIVSKPISCDLSDDELRDYNN